MAASSPHPSPPKEEREIESSAGGSVNIARDVAATICPLFWCADLLH
jgi:hypothetical protein